MLDPTQPTPAELDRIHRDAMRSFARGIPDPFVFAWHLEKPYCFWIEQAWRSQDPNNSGCYRVSQKRAAEMFPMGLCDRDGYLTAFGNAVRKAIEEQSA
jgi:hypothetical protein